MDDHRTLRTVKIGDAKTRLSELIARVEKGEEIIIARDDTPVARLVRIDEIDRRRAAVEAILAIRARCKPATQEEIRAWRDEGRRF
ncbi:MAG: type II toxin-antitoxin system prevent-host-death family antitoxin [Parvularculaceae bacterium]